MSKRYRFIKSEATYFITSVTYKRKNLFQNTDLAEILLDQFEHYEKVYRYNSKAYSIQPDHYHLLLTSGKKKSISQILHAINSYSTTKINDYWGNQSKKRIWQREPWTEVIRNERMYWQKISYILLNPWREDLVQKPTEDYEYSNLSEWKEEFGKNFLTDLFSHYRRAME